MEVIETPVGRREKRKQEIRARIEEAAYSLFKRQGIEDTSIEQICVEADVARRTFYGHYPNKHALLGGLGISRLYNKSDPMLQLLMNNYSSTRGRLEAMIDYIEGNFSDLGEIDRRLILMAPAVLVQDAQQQKKLGIGAIESFKQLFVAGQEMGDVYTQFSAEMLATMVVGTLNTLTQSWAMDSNYPIFDKLEEARVMFEHLICKDN